MALTSWPTWMSWPAVKAASVASSMPSCTASTVSSSDSPRCRCCSGAQRISPYTTPSATRSSTKSRATRARPSRVCMTEMVTSKVFRYSTSEPLSDCSANQVASAAASVAGSSMPSGSASSMMVCGRSPPSR